MWGNNYYNHYSAFVYSFPDGFLFKSYDLIRSTCTQNLTILALGVPHISLRAPRYKVGFYVTLTTSLLRIKSNQIKSI